MPLEVLKNLLPITLRGDTMNQIKAVFNGTMRHSLIDELAIRWWGKAPRAFEFQWHVRRLNNAV